MKNIEICLMPETKDGFEERNVNVSPTVAYREVVIWVYLKTLTLTFVKDDRSDFCWHQRMKKCYLHKLKIILSRNMSQTL